MMILGIDPGTNQSAYVMYGTTSKSIGDMGIIPNHLLKTLVKSTYADCMAIEIMKSYGMPMGDSVLETCVWIGRFIEACDKPHFELARKTIVANLCNTVRANDSNIRQALIDRFGGKTKAIGRKASPGPLYGVSKDVWSALAIAITADDLNVMGVFE